MTKHLADKRKPTTGGRTRAFMQIARSARETFHKPRESAGPSRLLQFLRIARGRTF
ncbi:hypothetical protein [Pseudogemmobacter faecipullorum]|uniref:Uncharacterized protein n=1 Tax=Pseudogemmobacter faecipullorum TaxID=2755041 RepID=A0ABS8CHG6_9RHOB|nr:hypothetical protein [Pseudogemmobacter faecipullorum]MCB5408837.1 hypothetical protein [Pseudogemmobacter faecipullorum]